MTITTQLYDFDKKHFENVPNELFTEIARKGVIKYRHKSIVTSTIEIIEIKVKKDTYKFMRGVSYE